jgi:hypothetical protein
MIVQQNKSFFNPMDGLKQLLMKSFCGVQGRFLQKEPLAAGGKKNATIS